MAFFERTHTYEDVYAGLHEVSRPHMDFYVLMALATVIATFGLLMNNPAVVIGAMLIAPLMDPILGISFSSLTRNAPFIFRASLTLISGVLLAVALSFFLSLPFTTISISNEVLARTQPSLLDLFAALATGFVAGFAKVRKNISGTIYGVAVSISLIPPLCVIGIGLANWRTEIYTGATLLFLTNLVSILFTGALAFLLIRLEHYRKSINSLIFPGICLLLLAVPLSYSLYSIQQKKTLELELKHILRRNTYTFQSMDIVEIQTDMYRDPVVMEVTVLGKAGDITLKQVQLVEALLAKKIGIPVSLTVNLTPVTRISSLESPIGVNQP